MPWHDGAKPVEPLFLGINFCLLINPSFDCKFHGLVEPIFLFKGFSR
jgi:hypothetical protein